MTPIRLVQHAPGAPGLRWLGLGPDLRPSRALIKLQRLFDRHAFWARGRSFAQLRRLLAGSDAVVSLWRGKRLVGFGRATSDGFSRAVLWDIGGGSPKAHQPFSTPQTHHGIAPSQESPKLLKTATSGPKSMPVEKPLQLEQCTAGA